MANGIDVSRSSPSDQNVVLFDIKRHMFSPPSYSLTAISVCMASENPSVGQPTIEIFKLPDVDLDERPASEDSDENGEESGPNENGDDDSTS